MAKRSPIKAIMQKQSSAYKNLRGSSSAIHHIDGSSQREVSTRQHRSLKSFSGSSGFASESMKDAQAERAMNPHGYSRKRNPLCPLCFVQRSSNGSCGCSE